MFSCFCFLLIGWFKLQVLLSPVKFGINRDLDHKFKPVGVVVSSDLPMLNYDVPLLNYDLPKPNQDLPCANSAERSYLDKQLFTISDKW